jgi:hypothetical protein
VGLDHRGHDERGGQAERGQDEERLDGATSQPTKWKPAERRKDRHSRR